MFCFVSSGTTQTPWNTPKQRDGCTGGGMRILGIISTKQHNAVRLLACLRCFFEKHETTAWKKLMFTPGWPSVDHVFHEPITTVTDCAKAQTTKKPTTQPRCQIWVGRLTLGKQYCCGALFAIKGPHSRDKRTTCGGGKK